MPGSGTEPGFRLVEEAPPVAGYRRLRLVVGWDDLADDALARGLGTALYSVSLWHGDELAGCGRIVGDGGMYFYLQDVIVHPDHHGQGHGRRIMAALMGYLEREAPDNAFIGLMAAVGVAPFYERYGFAPRPEGRPGMFRIWRRGGG